MDTTADGNEAAATAEGSDDEATEAAGTTAKKMGNPQVFLSISIGGRSVGDVIIEVTSDYHFW